eukprot:242276-Prymnesium_polylepis.2
MLSRDWSAPSSKVNASRLGERRELSIARAAVPGTTVTWNEGTCVSWLLNVMSEAFSARLIVSGARRSKASSCGSEIST